MIYIKVCPRLDSNCGPLVLETTTLPTDPQRLLEQNLIKGCRRSSVDSSEPYHLAPRVRIPSTPSMLLDFLNLSCYMLKRRKQTEKGRDWPI